jgi:hypothetical protein
MPDFVTLRSQLREPRFAELSKLVVPLRGDQLAATLGDWMDSLISQRNALKALADTKPVDLEDLRIREFSIEETKLNRAYIKMGTDIKVIKPILKVQWVPTAL